MALVARQIAEGELADDVIALRFAKPRLKKWGPWARRAGNALADGDQRIPLRRPRMGLGAAAQPWQMREAAMPRQISPTGKPQRLRIRLRHHDEAAEAQLRHDGARMRRPPRRAIALDGQPRIGGRIETDHVEVALRRALGAVGGVYAVPQRRVRLLQRFEFHR